MKKLCVALLGTALILWGCNLPLESWYEEMTGENSPPETTDPLPVNNPDDPADDPADGTDDGGTDDPADDVDVLGPQFRSDVGMRANREGVVLQHDPTFDAALDDQILIRGQLAIEF